MGVRQVVLLTYWKVPEGSGKVPKLIFQLFPSSRKVAEGSGKVAEGSRKVPKASGKVLEGSGKVPQVGINYIKV